MKRECLLEIQIHCKCTNPFNPLPNLMAVIDKIWQFGRVEETLERTI